MKRILLYLIITINLLLAEKIIPIHTLNLEDKNVSYIETNISDKEVKVEDIFNSNKIVNNFQDFQSNLNGFNEDNLSYNFFQLTIYTLFYLFIMFLFIFLFRYKVKKMYTEKSLYYNKEKEFLEKNDDNDAFDFSPIEEKETIVKEPFIFNLKNYISIFITFIFIIFYYLWYVYIYTYSIKKEYTYKIILEKQINSNIIDKQNKINTKFLKKLTKDTKTLSLIVDSLQETRKIGNNNNQKFLTLINQLNKQIEENNNEINALEEIKPISNGTIIQFRN